MKFQKYGGCKVVLLFLVLAGCMLTLCVLYYNKEKEATLSDVQACVKGMFHQEMKTRAQIFQSTKKIYIMGEGRISKPYPFYVTINVGRGEERFLMDSLSSMKNIAPTSQERALHSTSLMRLRSGSILSGRHVLTHLPVGGFLSVCFLISVTGKNITRRATAFLPCR